MKLSDYKCKRMRFVMCTTMIFVASWELGNYKVCNWNCKHIQFVVYAATCQEGESQDSGQLLGVAAGYHNKGLINTVIFPHTMCSALQLAPTLPTMSWSHLSSAPMPRTCPSALQKWDVPSGSSASLAEELIHRTWVGNTHINQCMRYCVVSFNQIHCMCVKFQGLKILFTRQKKKSGKRLNHL